MNQREQRSSRYCRYIHRVLVETANIKTVELSVTVSHGNKMVFNQAKKYMIEGTDRKFRCFCLGVEDWLTSVWPAWAQHYWAILQERPVLSFLEDHAMLDILPLQAGEENRFMKCKCSFSGGVLDHSTPNWNPQDFRLSSPVSYLTQASLWNTLA